MKKIIVAMAVFVTVLLAGSRADALVDVEARYWLTNLDSSLASSTASVVGNDIDFVDDLGLDDQEGMVEGRITLELGKHSLRYGFVPMSWEGTSNLSRQITWGGQTYTASTDVDSEITVNYHRLGYRYDIIDLLNNRLGVIFEVKYFDADATIKDSTGTMNVTETFDLPIPTVGVGGQVGLPFLFSVSGEVTGLALSSNIYMVDGEAMVNLTPAPFVKLSAGYRYLAFHVEDNDDKADIKLSGPFVALRADF